MATRLSKESRRKISASLEREEEAKIAQRKAMDERELRKLTTQARMMKEANMRDAGTEKHTKVRDILIKEKESLEDNLKLMKSMRRCMMDTKQAQDISNLFAKGDDLDAAIAQEKKYIADIESQIRKDSKNIQIVKKNKGDSVLFCSEYAQKKENERAERTLESWKLKLAAEQTQLALVIKENEDMRTKVQRLMKEKGQFNKLFGELMRKLTKGKGIMADIVERSRQQFQKRDEVTRKIEALRSRDKADLAKRMEEMQELEMKLYEDKKLTFFRQKVQLMREKLNEGVGQSTKNSIQLQELSARLEKANEFWEKLQAITDLKTCEEICKYIVTEDSNLFRLFNYNNEIRDQLEVMTHKTAELVTTVNEENIAAEEELEDTMKKKNTMEKRLTQMEHELNDLDDFYGANSRLFSRLLDKTKILFDLMRCSNSTLKDLLGENAKVTEHNYRLYLGLIETEVITLLETLSVQAHAGVNPSATPTHLTISKSDKSLVKSKGTPSTVLPLKRVVTRNCLDKPTYSSTVLTCMESVKKEEQSFKVISSFLAEDCSKRLSFRREKDAGQK